MGHWVRAADAKERCRIGELEFRRDGSTAGRGMSSAGERCGGCLLYRQKACRCVPRPLLPHALNSGARATPSISMKRRRDRPGPRMSPSASSETLRALDAVKRLRRVCRIRRSFWLVTLCATSLLVPSMGLACTRVQVGGTRQKSKKMKSSDCNWASSDAVRFIQPSPRKQPSEPCWA